MAISSLWEVRATSQSILLLSCQKKVPTDEPSSLTGLWSRLNDRHEAPKHKARRIVVAQQIKVFLIFLIFITIASPGVYESAGAAMTKHPRLGGLHDINVFPGGPGGKGCKPRAQPGLVSVEAPPLAVSPHGLSSACAHGQAALYLFLFL